MNDDSHTGSNAPRITRAGLFPNQNPFGIGGLAGRSLFNFLSTVRTILRRLRVRHPRYPRLQFGRDAALALSLTAAAMLVLDAPVAAYRGRWPEALLDAAALTSPIGWSGWFLIPFAIVLLVLNLTNWRRRSRRRLLLLYNWCSLAGFVLLATGLSGLVFTTLKFCIGRARPPLFPELGAFHFDLFTTDPYFASFPSGHAVTVGSVGAILTLFFPRSRYFVIPAAIWLGGTRAVVGVHYVSDIVAGLCLGAASTMLAAVFCARLGYIFRQRAAGLPTVKPAFRHLR